MIKALIFDCFGVVYEDSFDRMYRSFGGDPHKDVDFIKHVFQLSNSGKITSPGALIAEKLGIDLAVWEAASIGAGDFDYQMLEYVTTLKNQYKIAMLSNISEKGLAAHLDVTVLEKYFSPVLESSKIGFAKPEAQAYEYAANKLGVRLDECIMIDDREEYCEGAARVGMGYILYSDLSSLKEQISRARENL